MNEFYAYGPDRVGLETVMRFHAVKRWHMIDTTRQQTLAEHSANVALLAYYIAQTAPGMFFGGSVYCMGIGLLHDLPEVFTGDPPSPTKKHISGLEELEDKLLPAQFKTVAPEQCRLMVKMCDLADGIRFIRLHGVDATARHAREGLEKQYADRVLDAGFQNWPQDVLSHVTNSVGFYAYECS